MANLNPQCIKDIFVLLKNKTDDKSYTLSHIKEVLSKYSEKDILFSCLELEDRGYIDAELVQYVDEDHLNIRFVRELTEQGRNFFDTYSIDDIR